MKDFIHNAAQACLYAAGGGVPGYDRRLSPTLRQIQALNEAVLNRRGILLIPLVPDSLEKKEEEALLISETSPLPVTAAASEADS
jgi:hypothetical protein